MKVLVTGASGFVGKWLTRALLEKGHTVCTLERQLQSEPASDEQSRNSTLHRFIGDILEPQSLTPAFDEIEVVFHLAGYVGYKISDRKKMEAVNVTGTKNVISACLKAGCRRLIYFSSVAAVGASLDGQQVLNENSPYNLSHLNMGYFETKRQAEALVMNACRRGELDAVILNPSNIYGAGDAQKGSRSTQIKVARGEFPFYTSGGVSVVHIDDLVKATIRASEIGQTGERYILSGENLTIKELFTLIAKAAGQNAPKIYLPNLAVLLLAKTSRALESRGKTGLVSSESARASILYHWFDHAKAAKTLDFHPRPAQEAINESVEWMRSKGMLGSAS